MPRSAKQKSRWLQFLEQHYALLLVLVLAFCLRIYFATGVNGTDSLLYAESGWALANGQWPFDFGSGARRIGFYLPLAVIYSIFGAGEIPTLAWTMGASLVTVCIIYAIAHLLGGRGAGLIAAFLWAINPYDILAATSGVPDGPMAMFASGAVFFYLLGKHDWMPKVSAYALSAFSVVYGFLVKELILFVGLFLLLWEGAGRFASSPKKGYDTLRRSRFPLIAAGILLLLLIVYGSLQNYSFPEALATTANDLFLAAFFHQFEVVFIPIFLGTIFIAIYKRWEETTFVITWFAITAFIYEWAPITFSLTAYTPNTILTSPRNILFLLPPLVILGGFALHKVLLRNYQNAIVLAPTLTIILLVVGLQSRVLASAPTLTFAAIALVVSLVAYALLVSSKRIAGGVKPVAISAILLLLLGISIISPLSNVWGGGAAQILELRNLKEAVEYSLSNPGTRAYFLSNEDPRFMRLFAFFSGYRYSEVPSSPLAQRIGLAVPARPLNENALIVDVLGTRDQEVHPSWWLVEEIQQPASLYVPRPATLKIYSALDQVTADSRLAQLQDDLTQHAKDPVLLGEIVEAAIRANKPFEALHAFIELRKLDVNDPEMERKVTRLIGYFVQDRAEFAFVPNLLDNGDFSGGLDGWDISEAEKTGVRLEIIPGATTSLRLTNPNDVGAIPVGQHLDLQPNTAYIFEASISVHGGSPALLYWWVDGVEGYLNVSSALSEDNTVRHVFITPDWPSPREVLLAPVAFFETGSAEISHVRFFEFTNAEH